MPNPNSSIKEKIKAALGKNADTGVTQMLDRYWRTAEESRKELDWKWFNYDLWYNGNHNAKWDKARQQIVSSPKLANRPNVTINKVYSTLRGVRSYVLQNRPKAEVTPYNLTEQDVDQANMLNHYMDYLHDHLHLRTSLRASMLHALKYSVGWWQVMWDEAAENGQGGIVVNVVDPYDLYVDPVARLPKEARFMILAVRRNISDLRSDPKYKGVNWDEVETTQTLAASTLKSRILQFERGQQVFEQNTDKKDGSVILKEFWYKDGEKILLAAMVGQTIVRKPEDTGLKRLPFFRLCSDIEPLSMYGQGWCKNLIPLNKLLETNEGSIMEYNVIVNKGRYSIPKNSGVKTVTNQHGIFLEHKMGEGFAPKPLEVPSLNQIIETQIERINTYIEDMGCLHQASMGEVPNGVKSGVGVESLMEGDNNNLSELTENTEEFLEDVYEYMLELLSEKVVTARNVITATETGEKMFFKVIGEKAQSEMQGQDGVISIPQMNTVDVKIDSYLAYTADGRRQAMKDLASLPQMQNLPPSVILKAYDLDTPIAEIMRQMEQQQQEQQQQEMQMQQQQMQAQGQQQMQQTAQQAQIQQQQKAQEIQQQQAQEQANQPADPGIHQAIAFIKLLIRAADEGGALPKLPNKITPGFVQYLEHFVQSPEAQQNPDIAEAVQKYMSVAMMKLQTEGGAQAHG